MIMFERMLSRAAVLATAVCGALLFAWSVCQSIQKPLTLDETFIAGRAHELCKKGPAAFVGIREPFPHPPLHDYAVAAVFKLFGENEISARGLGLFCYVAIGLLMFMMIKDLSGPASSAVIGPARWTALALYGLNPLLIQHGMLVDADNTGTALFTMLFAYAFVCMERGGPEKRPAGRWFLAVILALCFLSKEVTPFFLVPGVVLYRALRKEWKAAIEDVWIVWIAGLALAWAAWWLYCLATGSDLMAFLDHTLLRKTPRAIHLAFLKRVLGNGDIMMRWPLFWMSAPFWVLCMLPTAWRMKCVWQTRRAAPLDYCLLTAWSVWLPYLFIKPSVDMMKYQYPVYPLFFAAIGVFLAHAFKGRDDGEAFRRVLAAKGWLILALFWLLALPIGIYYYGLGDYLFFLWQPRSHPHWLEFQKNYFLPLAAAAVPCLVVAVFRRAAFLRVLSASCLVFAFPINAALDLRQTAPYTTVESWMNYGEKGYAETIDYLSAHLRPKMVLASRDDLVYYLRYRRGIGELEEVAIKELFSAPTLPDFIAKLERPPVDYVVTDPISMMNMTEYRITELTKLLTRFYDPVAKHGSFVVYRSKRLRDSR